MTNTERAIREALEKQIPKKPIYEGYYYICPRCRDDSGVSETRVHIGVLLDTSATSAAKRRHFIMWTATSCVQSVCLTDSMLSRVQTNREERLNDKN